MFLFNFFISLMQIKTIIINSLKNSLFYIEDA